MNGYVKDNSIYYFKGIDFDPVRDGEVLIITQKWITDYSRRKRIKYGLKERNIFIVISNKIQAFENKDKEEIHKYIEKNWISFLKYAMFGTYPKDLVISYGEAVVLEPQWENIEDIKEILGGQIEYLTPISPYV